MFIKNRIMTISPEVRRATVSLIIIGAFVTIISDLFTFLLQFGKNAISDGNTYLGIFCILVYYTQSVAMSTIYVFTDDLKNRQTELRRIEIEERVSSILSKVRERVFLSNNQTMPASRILSSTKNYIGGVWDFKFSLPSNIIDTISTCIAFVGFVCVTSIEIQHITLFFSSIGVISIATILFSYKRGKCKDRNRKKKKELIEEEIAVMNDLMNIEPQNERHSNFMIEKAKMAMREAFRFNKKDWHVLNCMDLFETVITSFATIIIIGIKIYEVGVNNVNMETILSIIALQTIYNNIIVNIQVIVRRIETSKEAIKQINSYRDDVKQIMDVFEEEESIEYSTQSSFVIPEFRIEYETGERSYTLINPVEFNLNPGDSVLLSGATGCGKSTFMKMITGKIKMGGVFKTRFLSVMHYSNTRLGCGDVLSEVVFGQEYDENKLITIFKGLHLFEEILLKSDDVIGYLKNTRSENYSDGQNQRFLIARMLYNLDDKVQIVAFDEATRALNDAIAEQAMGFIREYCKNKLLIFASHQVEICKKYSTKHLTFAENDGVFFMRQVF